MLDDATVEKIKRLRSECYSWQEIAEKTGVSISTAYHAFRGRRKSKAAYYREQRARRRAEEIRMLRQRVSYLERELERRS